MSTVCHFKANPFPSFDNLQTIYGSAAFQLKEGGKLINIPLLFEAQAYEADSTTAARVSLRGGNGPAIQSIYQLLITFLN